MALSLQCSLVFSALRSAGSGKIPFAGSWSQGGCIRNLSDRSQPLYWGAMCTETQTLYCEIKLHSKRICTKGNVL
eukprot:1812521-Rhodomonas_salina.1